jgi:hypothetical protein
MTLRSRCVRAWPKSHRIAVEPRKPPVGTTLFVGFDCARLDIPPHRHGRNNSPTGWFGKLDRPKEDYMPSGGLAVVTGASSGIGKELARCCAVAMTS